MTFRLLIADDDAVLLEACLNSFLSELPNFTINTATTPEAALKTVKNAFYDIVLLDLSFTPLGREGLSLLPNISRQCPQSFIIMLTSIDDAETIAKCMQAGAHDFISKNIMNDPAEIAARVKSAILEKQRRSNRTEEGRELAKRVGAVVISEVMEKVFATVAEVRRSARTHVLITGPAGSGKELIAKAIGRKEEGAPWIPINSACISDSLMESELFGHERGAFTGADRIQIGKFEIANGGDIFLDEVARLSLSVQAKLLRVLQTGEYFRIGSNKLMATSARVIAATNENLEEMVKRGTFRADLLQRLQRMRIEIPPLQDRKNEIRPIVHATIAKSHKPETQIAEDLMTLLENYKWPGNVRELEDIVLAMVLIADGNNLTIGHLPHKFFGSLDNNEISDHNMFSFKIPLGTSIERAEEEFQRQFIHASAARLGSQTSVRSLAKMLKTPKSTLMRRLQNLGIEFKGYTVSEVHKEEVSS